MLTINSIDTPEYAGFPLEKSLFLPSPYLEDLICQCCEYIPSKSVEILTCRHLMCASCLSTTGVLVCPCSSVPLSCSDLRKCESLYDSSDAMTVLDLAQLGRNTTHSIHFLNTFD